jgi:hypothetical protein
LALGRDIATVIEERIGAPDWLRAPSVPLFNNISNTMLTNRWQSSLGIRVLIRSLILSDPGYIAVRSITLHG